MKVIAHMGASQEAPENTLPAMKKAIDLGSDWIELDVRLTKDLIPVVVHDSSLGWDKEIPESHPIKDLTYEELQTFDLGGWYSTEYQGEPIPTLEEVLALGTPLMIEIKWMGEPISPYVNAILPLVQNKNCVVGSSVPAVVEKLKGVRRVGIVQSAHLLDRFIALKPEVVALRIQLITPETIDRLHALGIEVWGWTIDDCAQAQAFNEMGLDGVITNNVRGMRAAFP